MIDRTEPGIKIRLDKERTLYLDLRGMKAYQKVTGKSPLKPESFDLNNADDLQAMLWACLLHEDKGLKLEDVEPMVDAHNIRIIQMFLIRALHASFPEPDKGDIKPNRPLVSCPGGKRSGLWHGLTSIFKRRSSGP